MRASAAVMELKVSKYDGLWHVHYHVLYVGTFLDQRRLSERWHEITGDSHRVQVELLHDQLKGAEYITKYITKGIDKSVYDRPEMLREAIVALRGKRLVNTGGEWRGKPLEERPPEAKDWQTLGMLSSLMLQARDGDKRALSIVCEILRARDPEAYPPTPPPSG